MAGNVQEWTNTLWGNRLQQNDYPYPYRANDGREDLAADKPLHRVYCIHRGGSFRDNKTKVRTTARSASDPDSKIKWRGFRVVLEM
jgi:iron(II)-dependent oxidoreductase